LRLLEKALERGRKRDIQNSPPAETGGEKKGGGDKPEGDERGGIAGKKVLISINFENQTPGRAGKGRTSGSSLQGRLRKFAWKERGGEENKKSPVTVRVELEDRVKGVQRNGGGIGGIKKRLTGIKKKEDRGGKGQFSVGHCGFLVLEDWGHSSSSKKKGAKRRRGGRGATLLVGFNRGGLKGGGVIERSQR